jgi:hypothetical protein
MKKNLLQLSILFCTLLLVMSCQTDEKKITKSKKLVVVKKKKTLTEKRTASIERIQHDLDMQKDPITGVIPKDQKQKEFENVLLAQQNISTSSRNSSSFISRGPSNFGGRTRAFVQDLSDATGNTMLAGGVSGGVYRSVNGGSSWVKVSPNDEIHNVTKIVQDPRAGQQNVWYYGTGEFSGNSAGLSEIYPGYGVWKSTDSGVTWNQIPETVASNSFDVFDAFIDFIIDMQVHPITGDLFIAVTGKVYRFDGTTLNVEIEVPSNGVGWTDVEITSTGRVYTAIQGNRANGGVWTSPTGTGSWTQIAENGTPTGWNATGRITLAIAPSNENIIYSLYNNGKSNNPPTSPQKEADLWQYNAAIASWTNYSTKLPDEDGAFQDSSGNDPFSIQGGYDLVVSVKPDNQNFIAIGGTNAYKINDISTDATFTRIGGYASNTGYSAYNVGQVTHHPDVHVLFFDQNDHNVFYSGTDGGVHKTTDITQNSIAWTNLNNNYQTYQYYHVNMLNEFGSDYIIGGAQDNGTTVGGLSATDPEPTNPQITDLTTMRDYFGGDGAAVAVTKNISGDIVIYCATQRGNMYRGGNAFLTANITPTGISSQFVTYFYMDPENNNTIYYAAQGNLHRTTDAENVTSGTWTNLGGIPLGESLTTFEASPGTYNSATSYLLIGGKDGNIYRITDPQNVVNLNTAVKVSPPGLIFDPSGGGQYTSDISIHPTNPDIAMVTYSNYGSSVKNIFITQDITSANPTWTEVERNLNAHSVRAAAITETGGQIRYFVGTARGLYSSIDPTSEDWALEGPNSIGLAVVSGLVYRASDNKLLLGTHGNGMFETTVGVLSTNNFSKNDVNLAMYPNPTQFELRFTSDQIDLSDVTKYVISDTSGKTVAKGNLNDKTINVSKLSRGMYIVKLSENGISTSRKFIKN